MLHDRPIHTLLTRKTKYSHQHFIKCTGEYLHCFLAGVHHHQHYQEMYLLLWGFTTMGANVYSKGHEMFHHYFTLAPDDKTSTTMEKACLETGLAQYKYLKKRILPIYCSVYKLFCRQYTPLWKRHRFTWSWRIDAGNILMHFWREQQACAGERTNQSHGLPYDKLALLNKDIGKTKMLLKSPKI